MMRVSEAFFSGNGTTGQSGSDTYTVFVRGNPKPVSQGGDDADNPGTIILYGITKFSLLSQLGNVFSDFERERLGPGNWKLTAHYKSPESNRQTNDGSFSFQIGGGSQHITTSLHTDIYTPDGKEDDPAFGPDYAGAINVGADYSVAGVDIKVGNFSFKTTFYVDPKAMTSDFVAELKLGVAKVNSDSISLNVDGITQEFQPGELLLSNVDGQKRIGFGDWELSLGWDSSPNLSDFSIGSGHNKTTIDSKRGWDYLWVAYQPSADDDAGAVSQSILGVYIEQVYQYLPLSGLIPETKFGNDNTQPWTIPSLVPGTGFGSFQGA